MNVFIILNKDDKFLRVCKDKETAERILSEYKKGFPALSAKQGPHRVLEEPLAGAEGSPGPS